jgi:hypothetical protein
LERQVLQYIRPSPAAHVGPKLAEPYRMPPSPGGGVTLTTNGEFLSEPGRSKRIPECFSQMTLVDPKSTFVLCRLFSQSAPLPPYLFAVRSIYPIEFDPNQGATSQFCLER